MFSLLKAQTDQEEVTTEGHLDCFLNDVFFGQIHYTDIVSKCSVLDCMELFKICDAVDEEYQYLCLENSVLEDFLNQNDPKMLIGLTEEDLLSDLKKVPSVQETDAKIKFVSGITDHDRKASRPVDAVSVGSSNMSLMKRGQSITAQALDRKTRECRLNYKTKVELTNKSAIEMKQKIRFQERSACNDFKKLETMIEEIKYQLSELDGTLESFDVNVVTIGSDPITRIISSEKFVKFCRQFLNSGMAICSKMRINQNNLQQEISNLGNLLVAKQEKSGVLTEVDFKTVLIKKELEARTFKDQMNGVDFLKNFKGRVGYTLNFIRKDLQTTENQLKTLVKKVTDAKRRIVKVEKDASLAQEERDTAIENLERLNLQMATYSAPKTVDYIELKGKLHRLEKERKKLKHQIYLMNIRLKNALQKAKVSK